MGKARPALQAQEAIRAEAKGINIFNNKKE